MIIAQVFVLVFASGLLAEAFDCTKVALKSGQKHYILSDNPTTGKVDSALRGSGREYLNGLRKKISFHIEAKNRKVFKVRRFCIAVKNVKRMTVQFKVKTGAAEEKQETFSQADSKEFKEFCYTRLQKRVAVSIRFKAHPGQAIGVRGLFMDACLANWYNSNT